MDGSTKTKRLWARSVQDTGHSNVERIREAMRQA